MGHLDRGRYTITLTGPLAWVVLVLVTAFLTLPWVIGVVVLIRAAVDVLS